MSIPLTLTEPEVLCEASIAPLATPSTLHKVLRGTSALGVGTMIERGAVFIANVLAARLAGAPSFGAYSLGISTANNISTYAAGGIGSTAARFSGKYPHGSKGYSTLGRALIIVSIVSALVAAVALWAGAGQLARVLQKPEMAYLLRWAAISAVGTIVLECARGFFVGQRHLTAIVLLSLFVGMGMVFALPIASLTHKPVRMLVSQGIVPISAVAFCLLMARRLGVFSTMPIHDALPLGPMLREVWSFGFIQLAGMVSANLAGWWLTALVARSDSTLVQIGFFSIASQLRNLAGLAPGLLTEGSYAVIADPSGESLRTPQRVMTFCAFVCSFAAITIAAVGMIIAPWFLLRLYGKNYEPAALATVIGLATAVVHMGNAPAAARLSIVSIRTTGGINSVWAAFVAASATLFLLHKSSAASAMVIFFVAHVISAGLVLFALYRKDYLPQSMVQLFALSTCTVTALAVLAAFRAQIFSHKTSLTVFMIMTAALGILAVVTLAKKHGLQAVILSLGNALINLLSTARTAQKTKREKAVYGA